MRPQTVMDALPLNDGLNAMDSMPPGLEERTNLEKTATRKALYTDIDYNGHVNNVSYIKWIEDTLDLDLLQTASKMSLDINYLHEIPSGETTEIFSAKIDSNNDAETAAETIYAFEGRRADDGVAAFRAELRV